MTRDEIMALTERELEIAVGREVMGYTVCYAEVYASISGPECFVLMDRYTCPVFDPGWSEEPGDTIKRPTEAEAWDDTPRYSTDADALRDMENELHREALSYIYLDELATLLGLNIHTQYAYMSFTPSDVCAILLAPIKTKCQAALIAIMEATPK